MTMTRREAVKRLIASTPYWADPDEPAPDVVGIVNAENILVSLERAGVVLFQTTKHVRLSR
jgi:hypothetical protein